MSNLSWLGFKAGLLGMMGLPSGISNQLGVRGFSRPPAHGWDSVMRSIPVPKDSGFHRRHIVPNHLCWKGISGTRHHAVDSGNEIEFIDTVQGCLAKPGFDSLPAPKETSWDLARRTHYVVYNNRFNIFLGPGTTNEVIGGLGASLREKNRIMLAKLDPTDSPLLMYQKMAREVLATAVQMSLKTANQKSNKIIKLRFKEQIEPFTTNPSKLRTGVLTEVLLMEPTINAHIKGKPKKEERLLIALETLELYLQMLWEQGAKARDSETAYREIVCCSRDIEDSLDFDPSDAQHHAVRKIQNTFGAKIYRKLSELIKNPSIEVLASALEDFRQLELAGQAALRIKGESLHDNPQAHDVIHYTRSISASPNTHASTHAFIELS